MLQVPLNARCEIIDIRFRLWFRVCVWLADALDNPKACLSTIAPLALERLDARSAREPRPFGRHYQDDRTGKQHERDQAHVLILEKPPLDQPAVPVAAWSFPCREDTGSEYRQPFADSVLMQEVRQ